MAGNLNFKANQRYFLSPNMVAKIKEKGTVSKTPAATVPQQEQNVALPSQIQTDVNLRDTFNREKENDGLLGKVYNFFKNKTGVGLGSDKVFKTIDKYEQGEISKEEVEKKIDKYKVSRENAVQNMGDMAAGAATLGLFYKLKNNLKFRLGKIELYKDTGSIVRETKEQSKNALAKAFKSSPKFILATLPLLAIVGAFTKSFVSKIERISSKEFDADKKLPKKQFKHERRLKKLIKEEANSKNFKTGALTGIMAPITMIGGGIIGAPLYVAATTASRYLTNRHDDEDKSFNNFVKFLKDNAIINGLSAIAMGTLAFKKGYGSKIYAINVDKVVSKLKDKTLSALDGLSSDTAMGELQDCLLKSDKINNILSDANMSIDDKITNLINENIFAAKFIQITNGGEYAELADALKQRCPATRTQEQAQAFINNLFGNGKYTLTKNVGVGTVAESWLAKDQNGEEVCIKMLKEGINAEKIQKDKQAFINLIIGSKTSEQLTDNERYLINNIEDLANAITKETDFNAEMQAAQEIQKFCKTANVVTPIEVKSGAYVMEKAPGISVKTLQDYTRAKFQIASLKKEMAFNNGQDFIAAYKKYSEKDKQEELIPIYASEIINKAEEKLKQIEKYSPAFEDFDLTSEQMKKLCDEYVALLTEQFVKLERGGKTIHGDLHTGNVFVNLDALKSGRGKLFTLIDTGNHIVMTKEQTMQAMRLKTFIEKGNIQDLTKIILDGAILPEGTTKEQAYTKVFEDLHKVFFDAETKCDEMTVDTFNKLSEMILRKYQILPNNTQLNFVKAQQSANISYYSLINSLFNTKMSSDGSEIINGMSGIKDFGFIAANRALSNVKQEKLNWFKMGPKDLWNYLFNKNNKSYNSEELLTYQMKKWLTRQQELQNSQGEIAM